MWQLHLMLIHHSSSILEVHFFMYLYAMILILFSFLSPLWHLVLYFNVLMIYIYICIHYYWYRIQYSIICKAKVFLINPFISAYSENPLSVLNFWRIALLGIELLVYCWFLSELVLWHISLWHLEYMLRKCF